MTAGASLVAEISIVREVDRKGEERDLVRATDASGNPLPLEVALDLLRWAEGTLIAARQASP